MPSVAGNRKTDSGDQLVSAFDLGNRNEFFEREERIVERDRHKRPLWKDQHFRDSDWICVYAILFLSISAEFVSSLR